MPLRDPVSQPVSWRSMMICPDCGSDLTWLELEATCGNGHSFPVLGGMLVVEARHDRQGEYFATAWQGQTQLDAGMSTRLAAFPEALSGLILEVGAGAAGLARSRGDLTIMSTDLVPDGIADLGERAVTCPMARLPFRPATFDAIVALEVLEHIRLEERAASIVRLRTILKPGGLLLVSVPIWPVSAFEWIYWSIRSGRPIRMANLRRWNYTHETRFRRGELEAELDGFDVIGTVRWCRSFAALGILLVNPLMRRLGWWHVDLRAWDRWLPFDNPANQVLLARRN